MSKYNKADAEEKMSKGVGAVLNNEYERPSILELDEDDLPDVKNWSVGKTYIVTLTIKEISSQKGDLYIETKDADKIHARFEVTKAKAI